MITLDELMNEVKAYIQDPDSLALIEKAYRYAQGHHQGQFRRSGEPYMIHAAQVGYILATMKVGPRTICARRAGGLRRFSRADERGFRRGNHDAGGRGHQDRQSEI